MIKKPRLIKIWLLANQGDNEFKFMSDVEFDALSDGEVVMMLILGGMCMTDSHYNIGYESDPGWNVSEVIEDSHENTSDEEASDCEFEATSSLPHRERKRQL
ncbi:hypothetical protein RND81_10G040400 [Saponaria officinalis]|uniref:Uncharacterized protein n=1 Tax=Saponaria officinalis TaxID=3572 RepID=A0AAW1I054_SAPOF